MKAQFVLLCEDKQQEVFLRRFLKRRGCSERLARVEVAPNGRGAANNFVLSRFPRELSAIRRDAVNRKLIVMIDGDAHGVAGRRRQFAEKCAAEGVPARAATEPVALVVPTWNVEAWLAYLGGATVDEAKKDYSRLTGREKDSWPLVDALVEMCDRQQLRPLPPPSLEAACGEYRSRLAPLG